MSDYYITCNKVNTWQRVRNAHSPASAKGQATKAFKAYGTCEIKIGYREKDNDPIEIVCVKREHEKTWKSP